MSSSGIKKSGRGSRAGLGTSSGRPMTGRPTTGRPMTGSARPGTSKGGMGRLDSATLGQYDEEYDDEDDEDYESEDDGDVFAFVLPDLGPAPEVIDNTDATVAAPQQQAPAEEDETFYYDEATGAVYDSAGRLVEMPPVSNTSATQEQQQPLRDHPLARGVTTEPSPNEAFASDTLPKEPEAAAGRHRTDSFPSAAPSYSGESFEDTAFPASIPLHRIASNGSSFTRDNAPMFNHATSISGFPIDSLAEVENISASYHGTPNRPTSRDIGFTVTGGAQLDQARRGSAASGIGMLPVPNGMRQRNNRLSQAADAGYSPQNDLKFDLNTTSYDDLKEMDSKNTSSIQFGQTDGVNFQDAEVTKGLRMVELEMETEEDSPYPEVRASVSNIDDFDMPVGTFRAWFLCFLLSTIAGAVNLLLSLRYPAPTLTPIVVQLIAYPCGKLMAAVLPIRTWTLPSWLGSYSFSLNPGLFNIKEHTLISIVLTISISQAYALNSVTVLTSDQFYNAPRPIGFTILFVLSSQLFGFSTSGLCRRFLVYPASMIWPQNLVTTTILNTLHAEEDGSDGSMTRFRFFSFVCGGAFIWYFIPGFLFQALSSFSWLCWIWPNNFVVNTLFGTQTGLGLGVLTFDWTQVAYTGSPLVYPWWSECNIFAGYILLSCILCPILYFTNSLYMSYLPFNSSSSYDRFGQTYDILKVVTNHTQLDASAFEDYSSLYLPATYLLLYIAGFAASTAVLVHTILYHGKSVWRGIRYVKTEEDDIHAKHMKRYKEVPEWWYACIGIVSFIAAIIANEVYHTGLPVWGLLLAVAIPIVYILPSGFIYAMTGSVIGTNLIGELIAGYALPGNPIANQVFKVYALQTLSSSLGFTQDLKLGHYMKIPPRKTFIAQLIFSLWIALVQIGVQEFAFGHIFELCNPEQKNLFTCPQARVFFTASIFWGIIGPQRLFGEGNLYSPLYWALLVGALLPIPFWFLARRYPRSWIKFISVPIALNGITFIPPASGIVYTSWFAIAFIFQYLIRKYNFRWWSKYNFVTSAGMDSGTVISTIVIFLVLQLPKNGSIAVTWWGNTVSSNTLDGNPMSWKTPPVAGFAPAPKSI
ncbi:hypothetical protein CBS101457_006824 [Exobasidium rhododendri]|nr:hypothetical protein CBS101457_006824 [Exobasidium rhododendri]